jgi:hypothetical protein
VGWAHHRGSHAKRKSLDQMTARGPSSSSHHLHENKSRPRGENRALTPPPHRVTTTRDRILQSEESHRLHHKPGSTIPTLRAGSERTNRAAKWLIDEQYKVRTLLPSSPHSLLLTLSSPTPLSESTSQTRASESAVSCQRTGQRSS